MPDYKEMYLTMVRASEKALRLTEEAAQIIIEAQQKCEELYLAAEEDTKASPFRKGEPFKNQQRQLSLPLFLFVQK